MYRNRKLYAESSTTTVLFYAGAFLALLLIQQLIAHAVPSSRAIKAAEDVGYSDIEVIDEATLFVGVRGCGSDDAKRFTVSGTNPRGEERTFYVCAGYFKGGTVRSK